MCMRVSGRREGGAAQTTPDVRRALADTLSFFSSLGPK